MNKDTFFHQVIQPWIQNNPFETFVVMAILLMAFCYALENWG